jgi:hypothetical protein
MTAVPQACHSQQSRPVPSGQPRTTLRRPSSAPSLSPQVRTLPELALQARVGRSRLALVLPASCSRPSPCAWFEPTRDWGITMPLTRDSPSIQGDVPGPDPARAPPNKAIAQAGLACRGQPAGVYLASARSATRSAAASAAGRAWSRLGHTPSEEQQLPPALTNHPRSKPLPSTGVWVLPRTSGVPEGRHAGRLPASPTRDS